MERVWSVYGASLERAWTGEGGVVRGRSEGRGAEYLLGCCVFFVFFIGVDEVCHWVEPI